MRTFELEGWPDRDTRILDWLRATNEAEALAAFQRKHGCRATRIDGRSVEQREMFERKEVIGARSSPSAD